MWRSCTKKFIFQEYFCSHFSEQFCRLFSFIKSNKRAREKMIKRERVKIPLVENFLAYLRVIFSLPFPQLQSVIIGTLLNINVGKFSEISKDFFYEKLMKFVRKIISETFRCAHVWHNRVESS